MSNHQLPSRTRLKQLINDLYKYYNDFKYFDSKNEFIDHAFSKLSNSMTDEEVMKYFKKLWKNSQILNKFTDTLLILFKRILKIPHQPEKLAQRVTVE